MADLQIVGVSYDRVLLALYCLIHDAPVVQASLKAPCFQIAAQLLP